MLDPQKAEKLISSVPRTESAESQRTAASIVTAVRDGKTLAEAIKYYWLNEELAKRWWTEFGFDDVAPAERKKRGGKTAALDAFVKENIGKTIKSSEIIEKCEITTPTFYNYMNANRGFFKKSGRGMYTIVDPSQERMQAKKS
jgi:hypothetical protein